MYVKKIHLKKIGSTNDFALQNMDSLEDKTVIFADMQTQGKGRNERIWISERNNLFVSLVLKPDYDMDKKNTLHSLTHYSAVVLARILEKNYSVKPAIKWPNDILIDGKKIAGILVESVVQGKCLQGVIVGIGVNLNYRQNQLEKIDQPATSLNVLLKKEISRDQFLKYLVREFFLQYEELLEKGFQLIKKEYISYSMFLDKNIKVIVFDQSYQGIAKKIDNTGCLVMDCRGEQKIINIGDMIC